MKKVIIELNINEQMAIKNNNYGLLNGYLESNYFWIGLMVNHGYLPNIIDIDNIIIVDNKAEICYTPRDIKTLKDI